MWYSPKLILLFNTSLSVEAKRLRTVTIKQYKGNANFSLGVNMAGPINDRYIGERNSILMIPITWYPTKYQGIDILVNWVEYKV